jgi:hypothetical protein
MADRFDFVSFLGDQRIQKLPEVEQQDLLSKAWAKASAQDPRLNELNDNERLEFMNKAWEKANPEAVAAAQQVDPWEGYSAGMSAAGHAAVASGMPGAPLTGAAQMLLGSPTAPGSGARGFQRSIMSWLASFPTTVGSVATEGFNAITGEEVTDVGFHANESYAGLESMARDQGIENPTPDDVRRIAAGLDPEVYDVPAIMHQIELVGRKREAGRDIYETFSPAANWVRGLEAPASPGEQRGEFSHQLASGIGSAVGLMAPTIAGTMMGLPPAAAVAIPSFGIGLEEASQPIEEAYGEYRPGATIPSAIGQAALESIGGPEIEFARAVGQRLVRRLAKPALITAVKEALIEGTTEGAQQVLAFEAKKWSEGDREIWFNLSDDEKKQVLQEAGYGALIGGIFGGGGAVIGQTAQRIEEKAVENRIKRILRPKEETTQQSLPERPVPTFDQAKQAMAENAPAVLRGGEDEDLLIGRFANRELTDADLSVAAETQGVSLEEARAQVTAAEQKTLKQLGVESFEEVGQARTAPGAEDLNTPIGRAQAELKQNLLDQADAAEQEGDTRRASDLRQAAESLRLTLPQTADEQALHQVASERGVEVVFTDSPLSVAGLSGEPGVVVIDRNASKHQQVKQVLAHEMSHQLRDSQPEAWRELGTLLRRDFSREWRAARSRVAADPAYADLKGTELVDEIVAQVVERNGDMIWDAMLNEAQLEKLYKKPGIIGKLLRWFVEAAGEVGRALGLNIPSRETLEDVWALPYAVAQAMNLNVGAPRSVIAPQAEVAKPAAGVVEELPITAQEKAAAAPRIAPEPVQAAEAVPQTEAKREAPRPEKREKVAAADRRKTPRLREVDAIETQIRRIRKAEGFSKRLTNKIIDLVKNGASVHDLIATNQAFKEEFTGSEIVDALVAFEDAVGRQEISDRVQGELEAEAVEGARERGEGPAPVAQEAVQAEEAPAAKEEVTPEQRKAAATRRRRKRKKKKRQRKATTRSKKATRIAEREKEVDLDARAQAISQTREWAEGQAFASPAERNAAMRAYGRRLYNDIVFARQHGRQVAEWGQRTSKMDQGLWQRALTQAEREHAEDLEGLSYSERSNLLKSLTEIQYRRLGGTRWATRFPGFYSNAARTAGTIKEQSIRPQSLIAKLRQAGVSKDELKYLDLEGALGYMPKDAKGRVSMTDVQEYLDAHGVQMVEIILSDEGNRPDAAAAGVETVAGEMEANESYESLRQRMLESDEFQRAAEYGEFYEGEPTLYGEVPTEFDEDGDPIEWGDPEPAYDGELGEGARYYLITDYGGMDGDYFDDYSDAYAAYEDAQSENYDQNVEAWIEDHVDDFEGNFEEDENGTPSSGGALFGPDQYGNYNEQGGVKGSYKEFLIILPASDYLGSHHGGRFGGPGYKGVALHIRTQEFHDGAGRKVLFVEEIQSDWYSDIQKREDLNALRELETKLEEKYGDRFDPYDRVGMEKVLTDEGEYKRWADLRTKAKRAGDFAASARDAPMVAGKPQQWIAMAAKRILRHAAEQGYSRVAWTTAEQQVQRSAHAGMEKIDKIQWRHGGLHPDGLQYVTVKVFDKDRQVREYDFNRRGFVLEENRYYSNIWQVFGPSLGDEILENSEGEKEAEELEVLFTGGQMFRMIYDKMLPSAFQAAAKEIGMGLNPGQIEITTGRGMSVTDINSEQLVDKLGPELSMDEADALFSRGVVVVINNGMYYSHMAGREVPDLEALIPNVDLHGPRDRMNPSIKSFHALKEGAFPGTTYHGMELSEEFNQHVMDTEFRLHWATRSITQTPGGAIGRNDAVSAITPGEAWGNELSRVINKYLKQITGKRLEDYTTFLANHFKRVGELQQALLSRGIILPEHLNTYLMEELMYGKADQAVKQARSRVVEPILRYMNANNIDSEQAHRFLWAMHAFERNRRGYEINVTNARKRINNQLGKASGLRKQQLAAELKAIDEMIKAGMVPGAGLEMADNRAFQVLKDLVDSGDVVMDLDKFAQHYGYDSLEAALNETRRQQYAAQRKWNRAHFNGVLDGRMGKLMGFWQKLTQEKLKLQQKYQLINDEDYDNMLGLYQFYSPLKGRKEYDQGDVEDILSIPGLPASVGQFLDIRRKEDKSALGRIGSPQNNIVAQGLQDLERTIVRGEKNTVGRTFLEFAEQYLPPSVVEINKVVDKKVFDKVTGSVKEVNDFWYNERPNVFATKRKGEVFFLTIKDERLALALKGLGDRNMSTVAKIHAKGMRAMASLATSLNPEFWLSNAARDIQTAVFNALGKEVPISDAQILKMITNIPAAAVVIGRIEMPGTVESEARKTEWGRLWSRMQKAGGRIGYFGLTNVEDTFKRAQHELHWVGKDTIGVKALRGGQYFFQAVEAVNTAFENATRLVAFKAALDAGLSDARAASVARNLTVNFNRHGSWQGLSSWYMFANASVQGVARMMQALGNRRVRNVMYHLSAVSFMLARWNREVLGEDDDGQDKWDHLSRYHKGKRLLLAIPMGERTSLIAIPVPHGFSVFHAIGTGLEDIADSLMKEDKDTSTAVGHAATGMASSLADSFNPMGGRFDSASGFLGNFVPTIPRIFWDLASNEDYAGRAIRPKYYQKGTPWYQTKTSHASPWAVWSSKVMNDMTGGDVIQPGFANISPDSIDFLLTSASSGLGKFVTDSATFITNSATSKPTPLYRIPMVRRFMYEYTPTEARDEYYELRERLWKVRRDFSTAQKSGDKQTVSYLQENYKNLLDEGLYKQLQVAEKARQAAKETGDSEAESRAMLVWLRAYQKITRRHYS